MLLFESIICVCFVFNILYNNNLRCLVKVFWV